MQVQNSGKDNLIPKAGGDDVLLEEQFETLLQKLEFASNSGGDDSDTTSREKILHTKLKNSAFDAFLSSIKVTKPLLYKALKSYPLISGTYKLNRRSRSKSQKKEKGAAKEKKKTEEKNTVSDANNINYTKVDQSSSNRSLALATAQCIAEGSIPSALLAISVLLQNYMAFYERKLNGKGATAGGVAGNVDDVHNLNSIPVGNILGALFESRVNYDDRDHSEISVAPGDGVRSSTSIPNPFSAYLQSGDAGVSIGNSSLKIREKSSIAALRNESNISPSSSITAATAGRTPLVFPTNRFSQNDEITTIPSFLSDAGSTVSSLIADHGTEISFAMDGNDNESHGPPDHEELTEEELLVQALAMSLDNASATGVHSLSNAISLSPSSLNRLDRQTPVSQLDSYSQSGMGEDLRSVEQSLAIGPFPDIHPLSTFGPFCDMEFWKSIYPPQSSVLSAIGPRDSSSPVGGAGATYSTGGLDSGMNTSLPNVPLPQVITALLVHLCGGIDVLAMPSVSPSDTTPSHAPRSVGGSVAGTYATSETSSAHGVSFAPYSDKRSASGGLNVTTADRTPKPPPLSTIVAPMPTAVTFLALEYILDTLITSLSKICQDPYHFVPLAVLESTENSLAAEDATMRVEVDHNIALRHWKNTRYFFVHSITMILKLVKANFDALSAGDYDKSDSNSSLLGVSDACRHLLKPIVECIGAEISPVTSCTGVIDEVLTGVRSEKVKSIVDYLEVGPLHSDISYRKALRTTAIDAFSSGFSIFFPSINEKSAMMKTLLENTQLSTLADTQWLPLANSSAEYSYPAVVKSPSSNDGLLSKNSTTPEVSNFYQLRSTEYYRSLILQKICLTLIHEENGIDIERFRKSSKQMLVATPTGSGLSTPRTDPEKLRVMEHLRALLPSGIEPSDKVLERMYNAVVEARENVPSISLSKADEALSDPTLLKKEAYTENIHERVSPFNSVSNDIENILFSRLSNPELMLEYVKLNHTNNLSPSDCMFWGEICLLKFIQQGHIRQILQDCNDIEKEELIDNCHSFSSNSISRAIALSNGNKTAKYISSNRVWGSAIASKGYYPKTGAHTWCTTVDCCDKGQLFIGVASSQVDIDNYLGADSQSWGFIGSGSLWHNKSRTQKRFKEQFTSHSNMHVKYDSDNGNLYFSSNGDKWELAFQNLPATVLYPAVSMQRKDDSITFISSHIRSPFEDREQQKDVENLSQNLFTNDSSMHNTDTFFSPLSSFMSHALTLFEYMDIILKAAEGMDDIVRKKAALCHPFISTLFPSLVSAIAIYKSNTPQFPTYISIHLLPLLSTITKRLSHLHDLYGCSLLMDASTCDFGFIGDISGEWIINSAAGGTSIPPQQYTLNLIATEFTDNLKSEYAKNNMSARLSGHGQGGLSSVTINGAICGTRIRFQEVWTMGGTCAIDARLSLDGQYFNGTFKDVKTGTIGLLEAYHKPTSFDLRTKPVYKHLMKSALVGGIACSKLMGFLIVGMVEVPRSTKMDLGTAQALCHDDLSAKPQETEDTVDTNEPDESKDDNIEPLSSSLQEVVTSTENVQDNEFMHFFHSHLFSGGLVYNSRFIDRMGFQLQTYFSLENSSFSSMNVASSSYRKWFIEQIFPSLYSFCKFADNSTNVKSTFEFMTNDQLAMVVKSSEEEQFYQQLIHNNGAGKGVDEYVSRHIGLSVLSKIGGESMQTARRHILTALLYHSGYIHLCFLENTKLQSGEKDISQKPNSLLMDIWRASQRIIESSIRKKQTTDRSYSQIAQELCKKAEFLHIIRINDESSSIVVEMEKVLSLSTVDASSPRKRGDDETDGSSASSAYDNSKNIAEVVDFFLSGFNDCDALYNVMFASSLRCISRVAGLKAYSLLLGKSSSAVTSSSLSLFAQPSCLELLLPSIYGCLDLPKAKPGSSSSPLASVVKKVDKNWGHITCNLSGNDSKSLTELRLSFESLFETLTNLLQRCTWAGDKDGQCVLLNTWDILIKPEDHAFLNRIGIFRVLQMVLDDVRSSSAQIEDALRNDKKLDSNKHDMAVLSNKRVTRMILKIVHNLASQVAFVKDTNNVKVASIPSMQRVQSGPATLSRSLFDMLHGELFVCLKQLILETKTKYCDENGNKSEKSTDENTHSGAFASFLSKESLLQFNSDSDVTATHDELEGGRYGYRIIRLLISVSNSLTCQKYLTSPKWLTLFVVGCGCIDFTIQRQMMRLLRRLLVNVSPDTMTAYLCSMFLIPEDILLFDSAPEDDDVLELARSRSEGQTEFLSCSEQFVTIFVEACGAIIPPFSDSKSEELLRLRYLQTLPGVVDSLSAEAISTLRTLQEVPMWRSAMTSALLQPFKRIKHHNGPEWPDSNLMRDVVNAVGLMGGYIDRLREGGIVTLKPFSLVGMSESIALRLASVSHSCGILVSRSASTNSVEVVLLERSRKIQGNSKSDGSSVGVTLALSGSSPVRPVKLAADDVIASPDLNPPSDIFDISLVSECLSLLKKYCLPYITKVHLRKKEPINENNLPLDDMVERLASENDVESKNDSSEKGDSEEFSLKDEELFRLYVTTSTFRSVANLLQCEQNAELLLQEPTQFLSDILMLAAAPVTIGGLGEIEVLEERLSSLWFAYVSLANKMKGNPTSVDASQNSDVSLPRNRKSRDSDTSSGSRSARDGPATSASILASILSAPSAAEAMQARDQMMEMGFPKEWCEVALRRCRYNVEMAINLCFDRGAEMDQLVLEDAALQSAASSSRSRPDGPPSNRGGLGRMRVPQIARLSRRDGGDDADRMQQLSDMGFPASWCIKALRATNGDADAALSWILTNSESLLNGDDDSPTVTDTKSSEEDEKSPNIKYGINPLTVVSGNATIRDDLNCSGASSSGFPSIGCRGYAVSSGKWYYELNLHTNGCIQVGWVDTSYEGKAENGQGVGDDGVSWAYDGWRKLLWHETSSEWGAKWAVGDVVGCAVDMDNRIMSFSLNGFGEDVEMGTAFTEFNFSGGLYPCVSFNKNEKVQYNFGANGFKYSPPSPDYKPFYMHVEEKMMRNRGIIDNFTPLERSNQLVPRLLSDGTKNIDGFFIEDCMEEERGENEFLSHRRYFVSDESRSASGDRVPRMPAALLFSGKPIPSEKKDICVEFKKVASELTILYARLIMLRSIVAARNSKVDRSSIMELFMGVGDSSTPGSCDQIFNLVRESSIYTQRTVVYLYTMAILSPNSNPPANLGSTMTTGGPPVLLLLQKSISEILSLSMTKGNPIVLHKMSRQLMLETIGSTRREFIADWKLEERFVPVILKDIGQNAPSLHLAVWITHIMVEYLFSSAVAIEVESGNLFLRNEVLGAIKNLFISWNIGTFSPAICVKSSSISMLTYILQELFLGETKRLVSIQDSLLGLVKEVFSAQRLQKLSLKRIHRERGSHPICSRYLQSLVELTFTVSTVLDKIQSSEELFDKPSYCLETFPPSLAEVDNKIDDYNWDAISGSLLSDEGWEIWSGTIRQLESPFLVSGSKVNASARGKQESPPELLPGCKVILVSLDSEVKHESDNQPSIPDSSDNLRPRAFSISEILKKSIDRSSINSGDAPSDAPTKEKETSSVVGVVVDICSWQNYGPGTARIVKWPDGSVNTYRWGADNVYDIIHVTLDKDGNVASQYPFPLSLEKRALKSGFCSDATFGIVLRLRSLPRKENDDESIEGRFDGLMEWPDFSAVVYVTGIMHLDGHWLMVEEKLISGAKHTDWSIRFGTSTWRSGTTYDLSLPLSSNSSSSTVNSDGKYLLGQFQYKVTQFANRKINIIGDIRIQQSRLFTFDSNYRANSITVSHDSLSASCSGGEGKCCVYATVGFSSGVHYWEFKVEQCDVSNIFIGVSEKVTKPDASQGAQQLLGRWHGYGFVNIRSSYRHTSSGTGEKVYGDIFQTGDTVGVMLDMNRGRLSFFLDGMKYGEHSLTDLGEAFDALNSDNHTKVQPRTFFPVVGFRRAGDRVTITPRWVSSLGANNAYNELTMINRALSLMLTWSEIRPNKQPLVKDLWTYREAWRDWLRWKSNRFMKVRTRCKTPSLLVSLDITPRACVDASVRLGLSNALFHGDRIAFVRSSGRPLDSKEEAIILGSFRNMLWYRLDSQQGESAFVEGSALAWCLAPHDVADIKLLRRGIIEKMLPAEVINLKLPRIPAFRGGRLRIVYDGGAVMREGLEIDTSEVVTTIATDAIVYAVERRVNSSNISRFKVYHNGTLGWISERIRGGTEEFMAIRVADEPADVVEESINEIATAIKENKCEDCLEFRETSTPAEALRIWSEMVFSLHHQYLFEPGQCLSDNNSAVSETMEDFIELASTTDGTTQWPIEWDMQLTEFLSKTAAKFGQSPFNIEYKRIAEACHTLEETSPLRGVDAVRLLARASVIRIANTIIGHALPYLDLSLHEERWTLDCFGTFYNDIDVVHSPQTVKLASLQKQPKLVTFDASTNLEVCTQSMAHKNMWMPDCGAKRLRSMRRVLFTQTKRQFWESLLDATTTSTPLHQDEYEDPREVKVIKVNRVKATLPRLASMSNPTERLRQSVFGQMHREMRSWINSSFRRSYLGKGHGGQKRAFKVKFLGEGVNDYGGPYRAVFEQIVDEIQCDMIAVGRKASDRSLFPMVVACPNRFHNVGSNQDKFLMSSSPSSPLSQELMQLFGKLTGTALRHNLNMGFDFSSMVWRPLARLPLSRAHLETVDILTASNLKQIEIIGTELMQDSSKSDEYYPEEWSDHFFTSVMGDGTKVALVPNGEDIHLNKSNWLEYILLVERCRLRESFTMFRAFKDGLSSVVPTELFTLFTAHEIEQLVSGNRVVNIQLLKQCTEYEELDPQDSLVKNFWEVLEEMTDDERTLFLRFVWARSRMPASAQDLPMNFKLQAAQGDTKKAPDTYLPHAQTCFFSLALPAYSTKDILREKLLYAINNSPNMDADVRLHNAEGWADS